MESTIKSFEEACAVLGLNPADEIPFAEPKNGNQKAVNAAAKLFILASALNGEWVADWDNWDQGKYYPWFDMRSTAAGGSGFSCFVCYSGRVFSIVGSRLVFKDRKTAEYAGKQFLDIYRDLMIIE